jgi:hypothetical protein
VALRRRLPFLQKLITATCERFLTQQLSEPNHVFNCVGPAWLGLVGWHPFVIHTLILQGHSTFRVIPRVLVKFAWSNNDFEQWNNSRSWAAIGLHVQCLIVPWNKGIYAAPEHETETFWIHSE